MRIIVASIADQASITIKNCLLDQYSFSETGEMFDGIPILKLDQSISDIRLVTSQKTPVHVTHLEKSFKPDLFVFISKHRSETGKPALLTHVTGNWLNTAEVGGEPRTLGVAPGYAVRTAYNTLFKLVKEHQLPFKVDLEVTHHGPTNYSTPLLFIELGSTKNEWTNEQAGKIVAISTIEAAEVKPSGETVIGFGGGHYCPRFADLLRKTPLNISHIAPKYVLDAIDASMIEQAIEKSSSPISYAVIENKGTSLPQREKLAQILDGLNIVTKRIDHVLRYYKNLQ